MCECKCNKKTETLKSKVKVNSRKLGSNKDKGKVISILSMPGNIKNKDLNFSFEV